MITLETYSHVIPGMGDQTAMEGALTRGNSDCRQMVVKRAGTRP
jgi:hypothetical protein